MRINLQRIALQFLNSYKPYNPAVFEPAVFCSVGVDDDHHTSYATREKEIFYHGG
jgi:hypothetical protein